MIIFWGRAASRGSFYLNFTEDKSWIYNSLYTSDLPSTPRQPVLFDTDIRSISFDLFGIPAVTFNFRELLSGEIKSFIGRVADPQLISKHFFSSARVITNSNNNNSLSNFRKSNWDILTKTLWLFLSKAHLSSTLGSQLASRLVIANRVASNDVSKNVTFKDLLKIVFFIAEFWGIGNPIPSINLISAIKSFYFIWSKRTGALYSIFS